MARFNFTVNGARAAVDVEPSTPLLWVLRDHLELTGTKFGCGAALCGACTVHVNGEAVRSCAYTINSVEGADVTTIEGLGRDRPHPLQNAWIDLQVPQCGYCQPGFIMAAAAVTCPAAKAECRRDRSLDHQHLSLWNLCPYQERDPPGSPLNRP